MVFFLVPQQTFTKNLPPPRNGVMTLLLIFFGVRAGVKTEDSKFEPKIHGPSAMGRPRIPPWPFLRGGSQRLAVFFVRQVQMATLENEAMELEKSGDRLPILVGSKHVFWSQGLNQLVAGSRVVNLVF